jgi:hypothetical protein
LKHLLVSKLQLVHRRVPLEKPKLWQFLPFKSGLSQSSPLSMTLFPQVFGKPDSFKLFLKESRLVHPELKMTTNITNENMRIAYPIFYNSLFRTLNSNYLPLWVI